MFTFKQRIPLFVRFGFVFSAVVAYYRKNKRHFRVRMCEKLGILKVNGRRVKGDDDSSIKEHALVCYHSPGFEDCSILTTNNNDFKLILMKILLIYRDHPFLNRSK